MSRRDRQGLEPSVTEHSPLAYEIAILALLSRHEDYGFNLLKRLRELGISMSEGTIYPLLARMVSPDAELIRLVRREDASGRAGGRPREVYALTDAGRTVLGNAVTKIEQLFGINTSK